MPRKTNQSKVNSYTTLDLKFESIKMIVPMLQMLRIYAE